MYDLAIIGGGPAALAAAFYAAGKQLNVVMIYDELGGKISLLDEITRGGQSAYLPGNELAHLLQIETSTRLEHALHDRVIRVTKPAPNFQIVTEEHGVLEAVTVLVATGASPVRLEVPGADRLLDRGLGYSITTYAHLVAGQRVAVIGATNRALSGAAELARTAARVTIVAPGGLPLLTPLGKSLQQRPNVEVLEHAQVVEVVGADTLEALVVSQQGAIRQLPVERAFVALGLVPNSAPVQAIVETDAQGYILVNAYHETSQSGLYAVGDVSTIFSEQVLIAIGDGARAAMSAYDYLLAYWLITEQATNAERAEGA